MYLIEIAYVFQLEKPVIGFKTWEIDKIVHADAPKEVMLNLKEQLEYVQNSCNGIRECAERIFS